MNKKLGQVTYCAGNYGSALQCLAVQYVFKREGYQCSLIRIKNSQAIRIVQAISRRIRLAYKYFTNINECKSMHSLMCASGSRNNYLSINSQHKLNSFINCRIDILEISSMELYKTARTDAFAAFVSGSDQIWSAAFPMINSENFLRFAPKEKRIAYAPSFGATIIPKYNFNLLKKYISEYALISVREKSGVKIVQDLTNTTAPMLNDPVFHVEKEYWNSFTKGEEIVSKSQAYCFLFFINQPFPETIKEIIRIKEATKLKVVALGYSHNFGNLVDMFLEGGPDDFLFLIKNAKLILSDSFHALAFSLIFNSDFYVFQRNYAHNADQSVRLLEILELCDLKDRFIKKGQLVELTSINNLSFDCFNEKYIGFQKSSNVYIKKVMQYLEGNYGNL